MGQVIRLSNELAALVKDEAEAASRSIGAQVEHWARLGREVERILAHDWVVRLKGARPAKGKKAAARRRGALPAGFGDLDSAIEAEIERRALMAGVAQAVAQIDRQRVDRAVRGKGNPVYGVDPAAPGFITRYEPDGRKTPGHMVNGKFVAAGKARRAAR